MLDARCGGCHAFVPGAPPRPGPNLAGIAGRRIAGDRDFDYSPALRAAGAGGQVWDKATLDAFLTDPDGLAPGSWMSPVSFASDAERRAVVEALLAAGAGK